MWSSSHVYVPAYETIQSIYPGSIPGSQISETFDFHLPEIMSFLNFQNLPFYCSFSIFSLWICFLYFSLCCLVPNLLNGEIMNLWQHQQPRGERPQTNIIMVNIYMAWF